MPGNDVTFNIRERGARQTAREVDQVGGRIGALGSQSTRTAARAQLLGKATSGLRHPLRHLSEEAVGLGKSVLSMGLAFGSVEGIKKSIETTDNLVKSTVQLRSQFGLTTEAASSLAGVLQTRGISPMALRMGFTTLSKAMQGSIDGTVAQKRAFRDMGISAKEVRSSMGSGSGLSHIFDLVTERMTKMHGGQKKAVDGQVLLGRASKGLAPLLMEGALGMKQQEKWAREFGVTLSDKTVGGVEDMAAAQTKAQYAALGLQIQMGQLLAPTLTKVNETFADVVKSFRDGRPEGNKYARTIYKIGQDLKPVGHDLAVVGKELKDHPALLQAAALGFVGYKTKLLSLLGFAPKAYLSGLISGRAYARGLQVGATEGAVAQRAGWSALGMRLAGFMGPAIGVALAAYLGKKIYDDVAHAITDLLGAPTDAKIAADRDPSVRSARSLERYGRRHPELHRNFLRRNPAAGALEREDLNLSLHGQTTGPEAAWQARRARSIEKQLRGMGDPNYIPRTAKELRRYEQVNNITLQIDGKTIAKVTNRYNADRAARR